MNWFLLSNDEIKQITEQRNTIKGKNDYVICNNHAEIILRDKKGKEKCRAKISLNKIDELKNINWFASGNNYVVGKHNGEEYALHRFILKAKTNELVDHINHDKFDCRDENIRICTRSQNMMNTIIPSTNTSGFKGVNMDKRTSKWRAYITINKKQINLGIFEKFEDAVKARLEANIKYQGEFAYPNTKEVI